MRCDICGCVIDSVENAIAAGWEPEYYQAGEDEPTSEPVCNRCVADHLEVGKYGICVRVTD
jgi:hypothetical protein